MLSYGVYTASTLLDVATLLFTVYMLIYTLTALCESTALYTSSSKLALANFIIFLPVWCLWSKVVIFSFKRLIVVENSYLPWLSRNLISGTVCPLPKKWIRMLYLLADCPFNGNGLMLEQNEFLCEFCSLGSGHISKTSQCKLKTPELFWILFTN